MDLNETIYAALSTLCPAALEEWEETVLPDEFIIIDRIYGDEREFVDDVASVNYHNFRINYYGTSKRMREQRMDEIKANMKAIGFRVNTDNVPIPREPGAKYWGAYSDFVFWERLV